ncbi:MAG: 50S ribosomal protein L24 [Spirochaetes bacterium RBG_13_51_14]|nr:MAG: 50S ribosomal protein L24 [Spirochaetes bacterium RBG_13_51_14]
MKQNENRSRIKANDSVVVTAGADRGRRGKVLKVGVKTGRVIVEGINKRKKHLKPGPEQPKGGTVNVEFPIDISNVMVFCDKCKKGVRIGIQYTEKNRVRVCRKCGKNLD